MTGIGFLASATAWNVASTSEGAPPALLRQPALSPDGGEIAFAYAGDIWIVSAEGGVARRVTAHVAEDSDPAFSPDGTTLAFLSQRTGGGNLYTIALDGNSAPRRLTHHGATSGPFSWSPDGKWLYFSSGYGGLGGSLYKVGTEGGSPIRLAHDPLEAHYNVAVSPDGATLAFNNNGHQWWRHGPNPSGHSDIWLVGEAIDASDHRRLTRYLGRNLWPMWNADGTGLYYVCDRSGEENLWFMPLSGDDDAEPVTHFTEGRVLRPSISADGRWIAFERDFRIWRLNVETGEAAPVEIVVYADDKATPVRHQTYTGDISEFELSPDGKKVAFIVHGEVFADLADKGDKVKKGGDSFKVTDTHARESELAWSPSSDRIVYVSDRDGRNEIYLYDFKERKETRLTDSPAMKYAPTFSPDGKWIAFVQDRTEIRLIDAETLEERPFVTGQYFTGVLPPTDYVWSPDGRWIAFVATDDHFFSNVYVQRIDETEPHQLTFLSNISCWGLHWSPDGKFLVFNTGQYRTEGFIARVDLRRIPPTFKEEDFDKLFEEDEEEKKEDEPPKHPEAGSGEASSESETSGSESETEDEKAEKDTEEKEPEPVEIDFEGIKYRVRFLTDPKANASVAAIRPDAKTLVFRASLTGQPNLWSLSLEEEKRREPPKPLTSTGTGKGPARFTKDGKRLYYVDGGRIHFLGVDEVGAREGDPKVLEVRAEVEIDFHKEKMQAFDEAWTLMRDNFYDPDFHGCDWNAVRERFRPVVERVRTANEFREVLNLMVGELNASHLGAYGGGGGAADSFLGVLFDRRELEEQGRFKIAEVVPDSPVTFPEEPARVGEYLLAIDGVPLEPGVSFAERMQRRVGRRTTLTLNTEPTLEGSREIAVKPISFGEYNELRYKEWVRRNAAYVAEKSGGRLGYAHIRAMSYEAYMQFLADLDAESHAREGIVVDVRFNGGGHIAPFILDVLTRRAYTLSSFRGRFTSPDTNLAGNRILEKPVILVTNEHSGSNTEMFSEGFRRLGLGKVVGMPTAGAVIWTWGWQLLDGTVFRIPRMRVSTLDGENLEGNARPVDVEVERPLGEADRGVDSQLDVAVRELLAQLDARR